MYNAWKLQAGWSREGGGVSDKTWNIPFATCRSVFYIRNRGKQKLEGGSSTTTMCCLMSPSTDRLALACGNTSLEQRSASAHVAPNFFRKGRNTLHHNSIIFQISGELLLHFCVTRRVKMPGKLQRVTGFHLASAVCLKAVWSDSTFVPDRSLWLLGICTVCVCVCA